MYQQHFHLVQDPFTLAPNPSCLYLSDGHREALAHLYFSLQESGGIVKLTGEVGTGKTTLWRCFVEQLPADVEVAVVLHPAESSLDFLRFVCDDFALQYSKKAKLGELIKILEAHLLALWKDGKKALLIVEESQNLTQKLLEYIRLLTNLETNEAKLLTVILIGQPELTETIGRPRLRQLKQRISASYHLLPLSKKEVLAYIAHRLRIAGCSHTLFSNAAMAVVARHSRGVPRVINAICGRALLAAYSCGSPMVDRAMVLSAASEIGGGEGRQLSSIPLWLARAAVVVLMVFVADSLHWQAEEGGRLPTASLPQVVPSVVHRAPILAEIAVEDDVGGDFSITADVSDNVDNTVSAFVGTEEEGILLSKGFDFSETVPPYAGGTVAHDNLEAQVSLVRVGLPVRSPRAAADAGLREAYQRFFLLWNIDYQPAEEMSACEYAQQKGLECWHRNSDLAALKRLNRPVIVKMINLAGEDFYRVLVSVDEDLFYLAAGVGEEVVPQREFLEAWSGEYTVLWRRPAHWQGTVHPGDQGKMVGYLRSVFASMGDILSVSSVESNLNNETYEADLLQAVRTFQSECGLTVDGLVGRKTIMSINSLRFYPPLLDKRRRC